MKGMAPLGFGEYHERSLLRNFSNFVHGIFAQPAWACSTGVRPVWPIRKRDFKGELRDAGYRGGTG